MFGPREWVEGRPLVKRKLEGRGGGRGRGGTVGFGLVGGEMPMARVREQKGMRVWTPREGRELETPRGEGKGEMERGRTGLWGTPTRGDLADGSAGFKASPQHPLSPWPHVHPPDPGLPRGPGLPDRGPWKVGGP